MSDSEFPPVTPAAPEDLSGAAQDESICEQPVARFFGVPFQKGLAQEVSSIQLCPGRVHLATIRDGSELEVCNRLTFQRLDMGARARARMAAFRPCCDDKELVEIAIVGPQDQEEIVRWDLGSHRPLASLPFAGATALVYSGDGRFVAAGNGEGRLRAWHLGSGAPTPVLEASVGAQVESMVFHPEHPTLYATLATGDLVALDLAPSPAAPVVEALRERASGARFQQVAVGPRGYGLYLSGWDQSVYVVDTATGEVGAFDPGVGPIQGLQVLPTSGNLCVLGQHAVYLARAVDPACTGHTALVCAFEEAVYAVWELDREAVLVFHAAQARAELAS